MDKRNRWFFVVLFSSIFISMAVTYTKYAINQNYDILIDDDALYTYPDPANQY